MSPRPALFPEHGQEDPVRRSVARARSFLLQQAATRTPFRSSLLVPDDPALDRRTGGRWTGTYTLPSASMAVRDTPILLRGPLCFPIEAGRPVTFHGSVDTPFVSMEGMDGAWPSYFVLGSVGGVRQFAAKVEPNGSFTACLVSAPAGQWCFQLVAYATPGDAEAGRNSVVVGHPWREAERPGDVRDHYGWAYRRASPLFSAVALSQSHGRCAIDGALAPFTAEAAFSYAILVTGESDVEYAWAAVPATPGAFRIERERPYGGRIRLRLVELEHGCARRVIGPVWAEENAAVGAVAWPDLRIEYRAIGERISACPTAAVPARKDGRWEVELKPSSVGRVSLVDVGCKRVYGEYTMASGLLRSFNVPAADAGQLLTTSTTTPSTTSASSMTRRRR